MKFSYNWIKDYVVGVLPKPEKLAEFFTFHSFEVESVEKKRQDYIFDLDILPNRAHDCLSHLGIAKEVALLTGVKFILPSLQTNKTKTTKQGGQKSKASDFITLKVENKTDCPRYTAQIIRNVKVGDSPKWLKDKLIACGLKPINNIVDLTNFVMLETGQPLHAFDLDKIKSVQVQSSKFKVQNGRKEIIIRRAKKGETIKTLDEAKNVYILDENILVIADSEKPIAIAGIKGGLETGIDKNTKDIIIEAANFNPVLIRKASQQLKLQTDASYRFERDIAANLIDFAQKRCANLIVEIAKGQTCADLVDFYPLKEKEKTIILNLDYLKKLLGIKITNQQVKQILIRLGFKIKNSNSISFQVEIPTIRKDINIPEDLIEEIGRVYGYQNIKSEFPCVIVKPTEQNKSFYWQNKTKDILTSCGFTEVYNYSFCSEKAKQEFNWQENYLVEIENPISSENRYLRPSLTPHLLGCVENNFRYFDHFKVFELGNVFNKEGNGLQEKLILAIMVANKEKDKNEDKFFVLKGVVENLFGKLGICDYVFKEYTSAEQFVFESNTFAETEKSLIAISGKTAGLMGEVRKELGSFLAVLDFDMLMAKATDKKTFIAPFIYPPVLRDIALIVPLKVKTSEVVKFISSGNAEILKEVALFEVYQGKEVPREKKSMAFHLVFQSEKTTLSAKEVDSVLTKIILKLENQGWQVRK
ncbi:phenylalanine--tRNA ligase subunit beta [Candidatus Gribaldobacteria bacterium]|nr:phenylalanine--tRNA ligase subunit beta [Candidatus Gribaldobacteria bacterium]